MLASRVNVLCPAAITGPALSCSTSGNSSDSELPELRPLASLSDSTYDSMSDSVLRLEGQQHTSQTKAIGASSDCANPDPLRSLGVRCDSARTLHSYGQHLPSSPAVQRLPGPTTLGFTVDRDVTRLYDATRLQHTQSRDAARTSLINTRTRKLTSQSAQVCLQATSKYPHALHMQWGGRSSPRVTANTEVCDNRIKRTCTTTRYDPRWAQQQRHEWRQRDQLGRCRGRPCQPWLARQSRWALIRRCHEGWHHEGFPLRIRTTEQRKECDSDRSPLNAKYGAMLAGSQEAPNARQMLHRNAVDHCVG